MLLSQEKILENKICICRKVISGVYFLIDGNEVVYIGQSNNVLVRINSHSLVGAKRFDSYSFVNYPKQELNNMEAEYICKYEPIYNNTLPPNDIYKSLDQLKYIYGLSKFELKRIIKEKAPKCYFGQYYSLRELSAGRDEYIESKKKSNIVSLERKEISNCPTKPGHIFIIEIIESGVYIVKDFCTLDTVKADEDLSSFLKPLSLTGKIVACHKVNNVRSARRDIFKNNHQKLRDLACYNFSFSDLHKVKWLMKYC